MLLLKKSIQSSSSVSALLVLSSVSLSRETLLSWLCSMLVLFSSDLAGGTSSLLSSSVISFFFVFFSTLVLVLSFRLNDESENLALC